MAKPLPKTLSPKKTQEAISAYQEHGCGSLGKVAKKFRVTPETFKAILAENGVAQKPTAFGFGNKTPYGIPVPAWTALKGRKKRPRRPVSRPDDKPGLRAEVVRAKFLRVAKGRIKLLRSAGIYVNCSASDAAQEAVVGWLEHHRDSYGYIAMTGMIEAACGPCRTKGPAAKLAFQSLVDEAGLVVGPQVSLECEWDCAAYDDWRGEDQRHATTREARRIRWLLSAEKKSVKAIPGVRDLEPSGDVEVLMQGMNALDEKQRDVILKYYGIGVDPQTQAEIGAGFGVSHTRVQQILVKATRRLQEHMRRAIGAQDLSADARRDDDGRSAGSR